MTGFCVPRRIEGEALVYNGVIWITKGYQHPSWGVIAYPRYSLMSMRKLSVQEVLREMYSVLTYWDCLKQTIPVVPLSMAQPYLVREDRYVTVLHRLISDEAGTSDIEILPTGSRIIGYEMSDLDLVLFGNYEEIVDAIRSLARKGVFRKPDMGMLLNEYKKHGETLFFEDFIRLKRDSILLGYFMDTPYSIRISLYRRGFGTCIDRVKYREKFEGVIEIIDYECKYTTPARFIGKTMDNWEFILETYKILYAELEPGKYHVNGYLEERGRKIFIIPDHGFLRPL